mmetsp:Transcript_55997/g.135477  ORF Transcript_55997/g.135477 Transcript_55997/m.135477 type:complete len:253 (+) Transcript_55997:185-943(+)|eukprot:CAMPEP_0113486226 /NCGR_PEP_ID=MMETSP0014_2-20120614/24887_1 /TAXON_ID=2857 /ORGANISM="Nitzschia sp." /LENGTH=252 /DNA_ID=CAMNT_0000379891 /DNA_START=72 /DNA_END=830 /DNA_ORIENTATION=+ /assembly_acc=CAM_ASM_000159
MTLVIPGSAPPKGNAAGGFSMGTSSDGIGKSLDEMIADRRKDQVKASKGRGAAKTGKASTADRSVATGRAKREAAMKARRGIAESKKPSPMEVEKEVYRQSRKTATAKKNSERKSTGGRIAPNSSLREKKNSSNKAKGQSKKSPPQQHDASTVAVFGVKTPSKKAVEAAVAGMKSAGIQIPPGHMVSITFVPVSVPAASKPDPRGKKKSTSQKGGGGERGGGAGGGSKGTGKKGTGRGGGGRNNNNGRGYRM